MTEINNYSMFFIPYGFMSPHMDVSLAYLQKEIDAGNKAIVLSCRGGKKISCGFNLYGSRSKCNYCKRRSTEALNQLVGEFELIYVDDIYSEQLPKEVDLLIQRTSNLEDVKALTYKGADIGYAIVSALVSRFRTTSLDDNKKVILKQLALGFITAFEVGRLLIEERNVDRTFVFNARLEMTRGFFRACRLSSVTCNVLEVSQVGSQAMMYENALPLDLTYSQNLIGKLWNSATKSQLSEAKDFYEKKAKGIAIHDQVYTAGQKDGMLPRRWDPSLKNVVVFGSSADEFYAIGPDWEFPFYKNQYDGISKIVNSLSLEKGIHVYLRMHPNLTLLKDTELTREFELSKEHSNLTIIEPVDEVSSYALMAAADKIVTFGSSIGIEAVYWGKTSILAGNSMYAHLQGVVRPKSHEELIEQIFHKQLESVNNVGALMYSNFLLSRGETIQGLVSTVDGVKYSNGYFREVPVRERILFKFTCLLENCKNWNTFALAIREFLPNKLKIALSRIVQRTQES